MAKKDLDDAKARVVKAVDDAKAANQNEHKAYHKARADEWHEVFKKIDLPTTVTIDGAAITFHALGRPDDISVDARVSIVMDDEDVTGDPHHVIVNPPITWIKADKSEDFDPLNMLAEIIRDELRQRTGQ